MKVNVGQWIHSRFKYCTNHMVRALDKTSHSSTTQFSDSDWYSWLDL